MGQTQPILESWWCRDDCQTLGSAAVNAGVDANVDGRPRPLNGGFDMGYGEPDILRVPRHLTIRQSCLLQAQP